MTKKFLVSFDHYQNYLLSTGMAIAAACSSGQHGKMIFNKIIKNPSCDLLTSMRDKACEVLAHKMQEHHEEWKSYGPSDDEYTQRLVDDFEGEQANRQSPKEPKLEWIDSKNPRSGIMARADRDICSYFEVRTTPRKFKQILNDEEFDLEIEPSIREAVLSGMDDTFEEMEIDPEEPADFDLCDWDDMYEFGDEFLSAISSNKKRKSYEKVIQAFTAEVLSPILNNYKDRLFYIAAEDTSYFTIGRPYFYPIIAGERSDGSHEITIFEALNS